MEKEFDCFKSTWHNNKVRGHFTKMSNGITFSINQLRLKGVII